MYEIVVKYIHVDIKCKPGCEKFICERYLIFCSRSKARKSQGLCRAWSNWLWVVSRRKGEDTVRTHSIKNQHGYETFCWDGLDQACCCRCWQHLCYWVDSSINFPGAELFGVRLAYDLFLMTFKRLAFPSPPPSPELSFCLRVFRNRIFLNFSWLVSSGNSAITFHIPSHQYSRCYGRQQFCQLTCSIVKVREPQFVVIAIAGQVLILQVLYMHPADIAQCLGQVSLLVTLPWWEMLLLT